MVSTGAEYKSFEGKDMALEARSRALSVKADINASDEYSGASDVLAEALAKSWGNLDSGVIELEQKNGESVVMAYCWDLETNTRSTKIFTVKHERKAKGKIDVLTDPRDIYEMTANQGARRLRACILSIIPGDVTEMAVEACERTMKSGDKTPMKEKIAKITAFFAGFNVTAPMIEKDSVLTQELVQKYAEDLKELYGMPFEGVVIQHAGGSFKVINKHYDASK